MRPTRPRFTASLLALTTLAATLGAFSASVQEAAAGSHRSSSGLALRSGATLAPPKILDLTSDPADISRVVGDQDGAERRTDTNTEATYELQAAVLFTKDRPGGVSERKSAVAR